LRLGQRREGIEIAAVIGRDLIAENILTAPAALACAATSSPRPSPG